MAKRTKNLTKNSPKKGLKEAPKRIEAPTEPTTRICIKNVPPSIQQMEQVKQFLFQSQESYFASTPLNITDCRILNKRRMAFVGFQNKACATACVQYLHNTYWKTSKIVVEYAVPPKQVQGKGEKGVTADGNTQNIQKQSKEEKDAAVEKKKKDMLTFMGGAPTKGSFWSNDDGGPPVAEPALEDAHEDNDSDGSDSSDSSDNDDGASGSGESSKDDAEPLFESHKGMSDMDFLRAKTVTVEELPEEVEKEDEAMEESSGDAEEEAEDEVVDMKTGNAAEPQQVEAVAEQSTDSPDAPAEVISSRLFVRNLPFSVTENDLSEYFSQFGALDECHVPVDDQHRSKGFGFVSFKDPDRAQQAREECDGKDFQGRIIQVMTARAAKSSQNANAAPSTYKGKQEMERQNLAGKDETGWSASFVRGDAVVDNLATRLGLKKGDVLGVKDGLSAGDAAVRLALGETAIIEENRKYFVAHGIDMEALVSLRNGQNETGNIERSKTSILVKNLPGDTTKDDLLKCFGTAGVNPTRLLLPPSRTIAVVEYAHANEAKSVFRKLAYRRFKDVPLYLEWAPLDAKVGEEAKPSVDDDLDTANDMEETSHQDDLNQSALPTLYVKNLNFSTTEEELRSFFASVANVRAVRIPTKVTPAKRVAGKIIKDEKTVSMGFGFVEFTSTEAAAKAMEKLQGKMLAGHKLELQPTKQSGQQSAAGITNGKKKSSKLMVRNVPFQANRKELLTLFGSFGQLKKVRLPKKFDGNHRGFAFVDYVSSKEAAEAMKALSRTHLYGRHLVIEWAEDAEEETRGSGPVESAEHSRKKIRFSS